MEVFNVLSLGSALQLQSLVQDSFNNQHDTVFVDSFKVLCPTGVAVWLKEIELAEWQQAFPICFICGRACWIITVEVLRKLCLTYCD